nr:hypothetical protein [Tanacetum cinerariifolium]
MDEALVPHAKILRIGRSNFLLLSDIKSKESTLQLVYDELWATATVHHHAIRFKMDNKKHIVNLKSFRDMLHICLRDHDQSFVEPSLEEEILVFIHFLGHSAVIRNLTDGNINKLYQPWRSFAAIINKCLTEKSSGYDSLRLSQAQILWGLYHKRIVDYAYLMWEDFVYQVEHKDSKKSNEMYYPWFTKVIIHHFMSKDPSIPWRNKFDALLPIELTNEDIKNPNAYKEYYAVATGAAPPKPKASVRTTGISSDTTITPLTTAADKEGDDDEGKDGDGDDDGEEGDGDDNDKDDDVEEEYVEETRDEESFDPIPKTPKNSNDEGNGKEDLGLNVGREEGHDEEEEEDKLYRDVNINQGKGIQATLEVEDLHVTLTPVNPDKTTSEEGHVEEEEEDELYKDVNINQGKGIQTTLEVKDSHVTLTPVNLDGQQQSSSVSSQFVTSMLNPTLDVGMESIFETTSQLDVPTPTSVTPLPMYAPTMTPSTIATITTTSRAPILPTTVPSNIIQNLPIFSSLFRFDDRLRTLEANFPEFTQTNQFAGAVSAIPGIKIIKEQVKEQVKVQVSKILPRIEQAMNEQLKAKVLTRLSHSSKISYVVAADLSEMELKKILIEKMKGNKSIQRSNEQRNLYKALVEAYESEKIILDTYRETALASESALAEEPMQTTSQMKEPSHPEFGTCVEDQPIIQSSQHPEWFSQQQKPPTPNHDWNKTVSATHRSIQSWISELAKRSDSRSSFNELVDTPMDFSNFLTNWLKTKDKKNRLMRIDELNKFNDGMPTDVHTALDDRLKGIQMQYLPQSIWRKSDKDRAAAIIQAIDKRLKTWRIMRSLKRSILTDLQVTPIKPGRMTKLYSSHRFIVNYFNAGNLKTEVKVPGSSCLTNS